MNTRQRCWNCACDGGNQITWKVHNRGWQWEQRRTRQSPEEAWSWRICSCNISSNNKKMIVDVKRKQKDCSNGDGEMQSCWTVRYGTHCTGLTKEMDSQGYLKKQRISALTQWTWLSVQYEGCVTLYMLVHRILYFRTSDISR